MESDAVEVDFAALSTASSLDCLLNHYVQLQKKYMDVTKAYVGLVTDTPTQFNEQELVLSFGNTAVQLATAVGRACELLGDLAELQGGTAPAESLAQDDEVPGCTEASFLMGLLGHQLLLMEQWLAGKPLLQADRMKLKIASDIASSGLLSPLARLCDTVAATVMQQQAQQQQLRSEVQTIVCTLFELTAGLLVSWPGKWYSGRTLAPVLPSLLRLLVSAICSSNSSGSWFKGCVAPYYMGSVLPLLMLRVYTELEPVAKAVTEGQLDSLGGLPSETVDILQSHALQHITLLAVASLVEQLHQHTMGTGEHCASSGTQQEQRLQVVAAHKELYRAVGLCDCLILSRNPIPDSPVRLRLLGLISGLISAAATVLTCQEAVQAHSCTNSSNRGSPQQQQQQQMMLVQPKVCYALLSVVVEVLELNPDNCSMAVSLLACIDRLLVLLESQLSVASTETAVHRLSGSVLAVHRNAADIWDYMQRSLELVLLQLIPVVMQSLRTTAAATVGADSNEGDSNSGSNEAVCRKSLAQLLEHVSTARWTPTAIVDATAVLTAYQQNPVITLSSLEAGLRLLATEAADYASPTQNIYFQSVLGSYLATLAVELRAVTSQQTAINAEHEQQQQQPQQQQKLISLGMSMLKCCKRLRSCDRDWQLIGLTAMVLEVSLLVAAAVTGSSNLAGINSQPASITIVEAGMQTPALVFIGRCLLVVADCIYAQLSTSSNRDQLPDLISPELWSNIRTMLQHVTAAVQLLQQHSAASVSIGSTSATAELVAAAVKALQQQAVSLHESLVAAQGPWQELLQQPLPQTEEVPGSPGTSELIPDGHTSANLALALLKLGFGASGEVAQQLADFAAAVCAAVPVPCCCNNPDCENLSGFSDSELVSGKSCVCARCEVARYCGKECQAAHWPQHKAACKRIKASKKAGLAVGMSTPTL